MATTQKVGRLEDPIWQRYTPVGDWIPSTKRRRARYTLSSLELDGKVQKLRTHVTLKCTKSTPVLRHAVDKLMLPFLTQARQP